MTQGFVLWFTGLPCSGKTTIADALSPLLKEKKLKIERLDGDIVRQSLTKDLGFSQEDRKTNLERITFVAKLLSRNNVGVLCTFVSPYKEVRKKIRNEVTNFIEVYVKASAEKCAIRDVKGMWKKAKKGIIKNFTGYNDPYEVPNNAEIVVNTEKETLKESINKILDYLKQRKFI